MGDPGSSGDPVGEGQPKNTSHQQLDWQGMLQHAVTFKQEGNDLYKQRDYKKAAGKYHRGLLYIKGIHSSHTQLPFLPPDMQPKHEQPSPQGLDDISSLNVDLHNNLAACLLQMESPRYDRICQYCETVLGEQPNNSKAMYRQAVSLYHLKESERALFLLRRLQEMGHNDSNTKRYLKLCEQEEKRQEEKLKKTYKGMFSKMSLEQDSDVQQMDDET